jgi:hypothetical protein
MPPLPVHKDRDAAAPSSPRSAPLPVIHAPGSATARQYKILQSSRAPAQLTLALRRA